MPYFETSQGRIEISQEELDIILSTDKSKEKESQILIDKFRNLISKNSKHGKN